MPLLQHARVTKTIIVGSWVASLVSYYTKSDGVVSQLLPTVPMVCSSTGELIFLSMYFYGLRVLERKHGSFGYACSILTASVIAIVLSPSVFLTRGVPAVAVPLMALAVKFFQGIPSLGKSALGPVQISDKVFVYAFLLQLLNCHPGVVWSTRSLFPWAVACGAAALSTLLNDTIVEPTLRKVLPQALQDLVEGGRGVTVVRHSDILRQLLVRNHQEQMEAATDLNDLFNQHPHLAGGAGRPTGPSPYGHPSSAAPIGGGVPRHVAPAASGAGAPPSAEDIAFVCDVVGCGPDEATHAIVACGGDKNAAANLLLDQA